MPHQDDAAPNQGSTPLPGGWQTDVHRSGDTITRSPSPWSPAVFALLRHLADQGFPASPRPIGSGFDAAGNEHLSFMPGASPQPHAWSDEAITRIGEWLGELHGALSSFEAPADAIWKDWLGRSLGDPSRGFGHGDLGPWNIMMVDDCMPSGFIDWDTAGPVDPIWELAQAAWLNAQLHDDDVAEAQGLGDAGQRSRQLRLMLDGYGLPRANRRDFVDKMIAFALYTSREEAKAHGVSPESSDALDDRGFPVMWAITWRMRSAAWMRWNRDLLEDAILK